MREYVNRERRNDRFVKMYYEMKEENKKLFKRVKELEKRLTVKEEEVRNE